jgi:hypothetical protein
LFSLGHHDFLPQHLQMDSKEQMVQYITGSRTLARISSAIRSVTYVASLQVAGILIFLVLSVDI